MLPHFAVHRWSDQNRRAGGESDGRERVVGKAIRHGSESIRRSGGDEEEIGLVSELDVPGLPALFLSKQIGDNRILGERAQGQRSDEFESGFRQYTGHDVASLGKLAREVRRLVGCNGTGDAEDDAGHGVTINAKIRPQSANYEGACHPAP